MRKIQPAIRAYLQVTLSIPEPRRKDLTTRIFLPLRTRLLDRTPGAVAMDLLVRSEDIQVLHGFDTLENARIYLSSGLFRELLGQLAELAGTEAEVVLYNVD